MMDVFALNDALLERYTAFARSFTRIRSTEIKAKVDALYAGRRFWPEPLIQLNPHYESGGSLSALVGPDGLTPETAAIFRDLRAPADAADPSLKLRRHQAQAIGLALDGKSFVVTTGTGSGKSLCFFIPIVDAVVKARRAGEGPRTRAIVIYPMNALANSQQEELKKFLEGPHAPVCVSFARYTGQESQAEREKIRTNPPDILLTNFMMLELLLTRQAELDRQVIENCRGLEFIVLDELHTYRGRQGADVAMLMRRLKGRVGDPTHPPICVGTSATMADTGDLQPDEDADEGRSQLIAEVATRIFSAQIGPDAVVTETLKRATDPERSADKGLTDLGEAVIRAATEGAFTGARNAALSRDALAIWVETRLGLARVDRKPVRARPHKIDEAVALLARDSRESEDVCARALASALLAFSTPEMDRGVFDGSDEPLFAFKLHQFISGAGRLYATLDPAAQRTVTFEGQVFDPAHPDKRLYATHFCRACGQEHHPVTLRVVDGAERFENREIDDVPAADDGNDADEWGFLMPAPADSDFAFTGADGDYPEAWLEQTRSGEMRLKANYRRTRARPYTVQPEGGTGPGGRTAWFLPGRFKFCPACGDYHSDSTRDINRLASMSAEGRSSATTVIIASILRWLNEASGMSDEARKLLSFTDNRQDAALQAGHFNDFVFVTLLRGAILAAVADSGADGLTEDRIGAEIQRILGFTGANAARRPEWLLQPDLTGANLINAERAIREGLAHRFWIDQRRGWRFTNPNLEQLGLIEARYLSLDELAATDSAFAAAAPVLRNATPTDRLAALRVLLDVLRRGLSVESDALDRLKVESLAGRTRSVIKSPWSIDDERFFSATTFVTRPPHRRETRAADETLIVRGSPQSLAGRSLRRLTFGGTHPSNADLVQIIDGLLAAAERYGIVARVASPLGGEGWRLIGSSIVFGPALEAAAPERENRFFRGLYEEIARLLRAGGQALFGYEGREHTAQVESDLREIREERFRHGEEDQRALREKAEQLRELGEDSRFLPILFCSPTMELGVDISSMNVVYLRNMPPTPANYAQRSGRAGRSGQAALIVSYCAAQSPHDQYFFREPKAMVAGIVRPPSIDLANRELVDSHLQAEWLAASEQELTASIAGNLDMSATGKPLLPHIMEKFGSDEAIRLATQRVATVLENLARDYAGAPPDWFRGVAEETDQLIAVAPGRFAAAFERWRDLLAAAERQRDSAAQTLQDYSISSAERRAAESRQAAANIQIGLLLQGAATSGSDFYVYRYLATEGFLPGYNFPRLPLMAFVPGGKRGEGRRYIQRARFLAISEFGPRSLVYHEGRAYRVDRALLREAGGGPDGSLPTFSIAVCASCGAYHDGEPPEECHLCRAPLDGTAIVRDLHRIDNVGTHAVERITANDEERRRQGFDLQTAFSFRGSASELRRVLSDADGPVVTAVFAPAVTVRRINKGLRRRAHESDVGFLIDPRTGYWAAEADGDEEDSPLKTRQRIVPLVEDRKNALLLLFPSELRMESGEAIDTVMATLQHALARGIETVYQLEEGEILAEPTPDRGNRRALFIYEAAEGGAGALSRFASEEDGFRLVARAALETMHYDVDRTLAAARVRGPDALAEASDPHCVAGCYRCLLSYYNQPDHELIDRRDAVALRFLVRLAFANGRAPDADRARGRTPEGVPSPDPQPIFAAGVSLDLVWRKGRVAAVDEALASEALAGALDAMGVELIVLPTEAAARAAAIARLNALLSEARA